MDDADPLRMLSVLGGSPLFLVIPLTLVNTVRLYEFLRTECPWEQAKRGAMLLLWYGAILLWVSWTS